jgi:hypothetical protein
MKFIVKYVENHLWFVERSNQFMRGTHRFRYLLRYPIAYIKFMSNAMKMDIKELSLRNTNDTNSSDRRE